MRVGDSFSEFEGADEAWLADGLWSVGEDRELETSCVKEIICALILLFFWHLLLDIVGGSQWELGYDPIFAIEEEQWGHRSQ